VNDSSSRRLKDRIAVFLESIEANQSTGNMRTAYTFAPGDSTNPARILLSEPLSSQVQLQRSLNNESTEKTRDGNPDRYHPRPKFPDCVLVERRWKRSRMESSQNEACRLHTNIHSLPQAVEARPADSPRAIQSSQGVTMTHSVRTGPTADGNNRTMLEIPFINKMPVFDTTSFQARHGPHGVPTTPLLSCSKTDRHPPVMTALEKAKLDWETHITAMERVLAANREQGIPRGQISADALQLLSQMVSNLYTLNSKLHFERTQHILEMHRKNTERINEVFQGLAGVRRVGEKRKGS